MADAFVAITENALDFLESALDDFVSRPKNSVITFYAAVELFLKARLLREHWTLVVRREPDLKTFQAGGFESITYKEARMRLENVVQSALTDDAHVAFEAVRRHRNRMIHFFHDGSDREKATIASEQLRAWYALNRLLTIQWAPHFDRWATRIGTIEKRLSMHRAYLRAKFQDLTSTIDAKRARGSVFDKCESCGFRSAEIEVEVDLVWTATCLVCDQRSSWLAIACPECGEENKTEPGFGFECSSCQHAISYDDLVAVLDEDNADVSSGEEPRTPANCGWCDGYQTVATHGGRFVCISCLEVSDDIFVCEWCNERTTKELDDSFLSGCGACDGRIGWKDD